MFTLRLFQWEQDDSPIAKRLLLIRNLTNEQAKERLGYVIDQMVRHTRGVVELQTETSNKFFATQVFDDGNRTRSGRMCGAKILQMWLAGPSAVNTEP